MANGERIAVHVTPQILPLVSTTPEDLERVREITPAGRREAACRRQFAKLSAEAPRRARSPRSRLS